MNGISKRLVALALFIGPVVANAELIPVAGSDGNLMVDDTTLGVTWADVASPQIELWSATGLPGSAQAYVASLNAENYGGYNDWTLPTGDGNYTTGDCGLGCGASTSATLNQLGYLFINELGNTPGVDMGINPQAALSNINPFQNLNPSNNWWTGSSPSYNSVWVFVSESKGEATTVYMASLPNLQVLAVRQGLAPVLPGSAVTYEFTATVYGAEGIFQNLNGAAVNGTFTFDLGHANAAQSTGTFGSTSAPWTALSSGGSFGGAPGVVPLLFTMVMWNSETAQLIYATSATVGAFGGDSSTIGGDATGTVPKFEANEAVETTTYVNGSGFTIHAASGTAAFLSNGLPVFDTIEGSTGQVNAGRPDVTGNLSFNIISAAPVVPIVTCPAASAPANLPYSSALTVVGGIPPYSFSLTTGSLPTGLTLNSSTGAITGASTVLGAANFTAQVVDSSGLAVGTVMTACTITVKNPTLPTVTPVVTGTLGTNGWYTSTTTMLKWTVTGFPIPTSSGCGTISVPQTTGTIYTCSATNSVGSAKNSVTIKEDSVAPSVVIKTPAANAVYSLNAKVLASYSCVDATSGVASCTGTVPNGASINTSSLGAQTFTVTGTDKAGNTITTSALYTVKPATATPASNAGGGGGGGIDKTSIGVLIFLSLLGYKRSGMRTIGMQ